MILNILFIKRKEMFEGECGIEARECMNFFSYLDKPGYLDNKLKEYRKNKNIVSARIIEVKVDEKQIHDILFPKSKPITGKIEQQESDAA